MTETSILYISISCVIITLIICGTVIFNNWYDNWRRNTIDIIKEKIKYFYNIYVHEKQNGEKVCSAEDKDIINLLLFLNDKMINL